MTPVQSPEFASAARESHATNGSVLPSVSVPAVNVLGVRFHALRRVEVLDLIDSYIKEGRPRQVSFSNAYTVAIAQDDPQFRAVLNASDLTLADGMSIVWGSRWIGLKLPERVAGPDLMASLCERSMQKGYRVFLLGSTPENLAQLEKMLRRKWPELQIVGTFSPPMVNRLTEKDNREIRERIHSYQPQIVFVGLSAPKQEKWIAENIAHLNVPVLLGVGAAFDFLSERIPRAPLLMQRLGLEWVFRLYCEPRRLWRRYLLGNFIFLSLLLKEAFQRKTKSAH